MINAIGISTRSLVFELAPTFQGNKSERLREAWRVVRAILNVCCKDTRLIDDMGICPNCCTGDYLMVDEPYVRCMNCGSEWLVIDDGYNGLLDTSPSPVTGKSEQT
jgi:hypothetical protein